MGKLDTITVQRINSGAHPKIKTELSNMYNEMCTALSGRAMVRFAYVLRSFAEQTALYSQSRNPLATTNALRAKAGMPPITEAQNKMWATNAPAGLSIHNYGLAFDIVLLVDKDGNGTYESASWETNVDFDGDGIADWVECVKIAKKYGWAWGGDWNKKDLPHFEKTFGRKPSDFLTMSKDSGGWVVLTGV